MLSQKILIGCYQGITLPNNAELFQKILVIFTVITRTKWRSFNYLKVNFYKNNLEKN